MIVEVMKIYIYIYYKKLCSSIIYSFFVKKKCVKDIDVKTGLSIPAIKTLYFLWSEKV